MEGSTGGSGGDFVLRGSKKGSGKGFQGCRNSSSQDSYNYHKGSFEGVWGDGVRRSSAGANATLECHQLAWRCSHRRAMPPEKRGPHVQQPPNPKPQTPKP